MYVDHSRDVGEYNPCFPRVRDRGRRRRQHWPGDGRVPGLLRGTARASCTAGSSRCSSTACSSSSIATSAWRARRPSSRSGSDGRRRWSHPLVVHAERTIEGSRIHSQARARARRHECCAKRRCCAALGDRAALPAVSPVAHEHPHHGQPRPARAASPSVPTPTTSSATTTGSPMPTPNAAAGCWRAGCSPPAPGRGSRSACSTRPASTSSWRGWRRRASARSPCRSARSRRAPSCVTCSPRRRRPAARCARRTAATTTSPRSTTRWASDVARAPSPDGAVPAARAGSSERFGTLAALAAEVPDAVLDAAEDDVTPGRPHGHRAHLGFDQRAEGRDPPARPADRPPRQPERDPRPRRRGCACSRTRRSSGSAASPTTSSACSSPAPRSCARPRPTRPRRSTSSSASDPSSTNGFAASIARAGRGPDVRRPRLLVDPRGNLYPLMPDAVRPADPELRHNMLGMTEAGSVCLMSDDETDQPEHRRGSFGRPVPGLDARVVDPDTLEDVRRSARSASCGSAGPSLMEGYYGRERARGVHRRRLVPHRRPVPRRRRRLLLLPRPARRHDQDRGRERVAARGRGRDRARSPAASSRTCSGIPDAERGQVVGRGRRSPSRTHAPDLELVAPDLRARLSAYKVPRRFLVLGADEVPDAVERQARPARARWSCSMSAERLTVPALGAALGRRAARAAVRRDRRRRRSRTASSTVEPRRRRAVRGAPASARARASGC